MQTTAVYVLVSNELDFYYEQALLSVYSLRQHNPTMKVVVLVDRDTESNLIGKRGKIKNYVSEIRVVDVPAVYSAKERSRYIKTTCRNYLSGKLLFIDTDTVISDDLTEVDDIDADIACVLDCHATLDRTIDRMAIVSRVKAIFGRDVSKERNYFNSGVIFMKDTTAVKALFRKWHELWKYSAFEKGHCFDQPALMVADIESGYTIEELNGIFNCQILTSIQHLHRAKIIHYFNNTWLGKSELSPFFDESLYKEIKLTGEITERIQQLVNECKSAFHSPTYFTCKDKVKFSNTIFGATCYSIYKKNGFIYRLLTGLCSLRLKIAERKK